MQPDQTVMIEADGGGDAGDYRITRIENTLAIPGPAFYVHRLNRDGTPVLSLSWRGWVVSTAKVSIWKCPYHNSRSCMELIDRARELAQAAP